MGDMRIRASSFGRLFDCAHAWEGVHLLGLTMPSSPRAILGTGVHGGTALFDTARLEGTICTVADATAATVDTMREREAIEGVRWDGDLSPRQVEAIAVNLTARYCREVSPRYEFTAVELKTKELPIDVGDGNTITLTGTLDRTRVHRTLTRGKGIDDVKTGRAIVGADGKAKIADHRAQLGTYELLYEWTTGEELTAPAGVIGLSTSGDGRIGFAETMRPRELLTGKHGGKGLLHYAADIFKTGSFAPNPRSPLCSQRYCARWASCPYHA